MDGYLDLSEDAPKDPTNINLHTLGTMALIIIIIFGSIFILSSLYSNDLKSKSGAEQSLLFGTREFTREIEGEEFKMIAENYYIITGLVVSRDEFGRYPTDKLSPLDITIAWGELMESDYYRSFNFERRERTVKYRYLFFDEMDPLPHEYITNHISNNHLIFSEEKVNEISKEVQVGDVIKIEGYLVQVYKKQDKDTYLIVWPSSTKKWDLREASSRVLYVEDVTILGSLDLPEHVPIESQEIGDLIWKN